MASENEPTDESDEMSKSLPSGIDRPEMIGSTKVLNFKGSYDGKNLGDTPTLGMNFSQTSSLCTGTKGMARFTKTWSST